MPDGYIHTDHIPEHKEPARTRTVIYTPPGPCISCDEEFDEKCPKSKKPCGHHCNHSWTHDKCCYCNEEFGEDDA